MKTKKIMEDLPGHADEVYVFIVQHTVTLSKVVRCAQYWSSHNNVLYYIFCESDMRNFVRRGE